jgi:hypothetical protein
VGAACSTASVGVASSAADCSVGAASAAGCSADSTDASAAAGCSAGSTGAVSVTGADVSAPSLRCASAGALSPVFSPSGEVVPAWISEMDSTRSPLHVWI